MNDATSTLVGAPPHMCALARANEIRLARAQLKRRVAEGAISVGEVALTCPPEATRMTLGELLASQRGWGVTRTRRFLADIARHETKTVGSMTDRQRRALPELI
jgi:hypothetical protein